MEHARAAADPTNARTARIAIAVIALGLVGIAVFVQLDPGSRAEARRQQEEQAQRDAFQKVVEKIRAEDAAKAAAR